MTKTASARRWRGRARKLYMASLTRGENAKTYDCTGMDPGSVELSGLTRGDQVGDARQALFEQSAARYQALANEVGVGGFINGPFTLAELEAMSPTACFDGWTRRSRDDLPGEDTFWIG